MKKRAKVSGARAKTQRSKATKLIRRDTRKATPSSQSPSEETMVARLSRELNEARQEQTATSEVLRLLSGSRDLNRLFNAILINATDLCQANFGTMAIYEGDALRIVAMHNVPPAFAEFRQREPLFHPGPLSPPARIAATKKMLHIPDLSEDAAYKQHDPVVVGFVELAGVRTLVAVPILKEKDLVGVIAIYRKEVRPFADRQIELVKNFAAQAVIAIENARLLNELRQSLEQQTATVDVLRVISSSAGNLQPVFDTMLENATRLCSASFGNLLLVEGQDARIAAMYNAPPAFSEHRRGTPVFRPPEWTRDQNKPYLHIPDCTVEPAYKQRHPGAVAMVELAGARTLLGVPMLKDGQTIGYFALYRQEVHPFDEKQIALVQNFASQAVIAIENARLLKELRERTAEVEKLNEHLEQRITDQVDEIERMSRLRRFLPPQVADLIVASGTEKQLESHRREITALFCDLRGFTGFSESADPEDVLSLLRDYHAAIGKIIVKYSGTLERYAGDGVMVVFNDPVPVDNPALQAVLMALEMRGAIGALTEKWRRLGHDIGFGIGIAHGFATLGTIGFEGRFDYAAIGTVSNVASRLCDEAKPGQILISPRVLMAVEDAVKIEPVGEFELKGIRRPLAAYNVLDVVAAGA
jgi:class 3 adenylate cyclase